jgi:Protein of unknown function (DUF3828)
VPSRRLILAAIGALPAEAWAQAQTPQETLTPEAFLRGIYTPYPNQDFKGQPFWQVDRFFAPDLARAIEADMREAKRRGEVPKLDGDPFVDAQDWDIAKLAISVKTEGPTATGLVSFENQGKPTEIKLDLVRTGMGWRIADIKWPSGTLSELYKK